MRGTWIGELEHAENLRHAVSAAGHDWTIELTDPDSVFIRRVRRQIVTENDFVILPLSLPDYWSFRLVEMANQLGATTRFLLWSRTDADPSALRRFFDGVFDRAALFSDVVEAIKKPSSRERKPQATGALFERIVMSSPGLWAGDDPPTLEELREFESPRLRADPKSHDAC
jgi:hypothetical protein